MDLFFQDAIAEECERQGKIEAFNEHIQNGGDIKEFLLGIIAGKEEQVMQEVFAKLAAREIA